MYQITDGNEVQRIANWDEMIATLESWEGCPDLGGIDDGDIEELRAYLKGTGYQVEEVA